MTNNEAYKLTLGPTQCFIKHLNRDHSAGKACVSLNSKITLSVANDNTMTGGCKMRLTEGTEDHLITRF